MQIFNGIISDRGSRYSVSGGACSSPDEARVLIKNLCRKKKFAKATHNTWAFVQESGPIKSDDGEAGAIADNSHVDAVLVYIAGDLDHTSLREIGYVPLIHNIEEAAIRAPCFQPLNDI